MSEKRFCMDLMRLQLEIFDSAAGTIPIIYPESVFDLEMLLLEIVYKGKETPNIESIGAQFVFGKTLRFIILSKNHTAMFPRNGFI